MITTTSRGGPTHSTHQLCLRGRDRVWQRQRLLRRSLRYHGCGCRNYSMGQGSAFWMQERRIGQGVAQEIVEFTTDRYYLCFFVIFLCLVFAKKTIQPRSHLLQSFELARRISLSRALVIQRLYTNKESTTRKVGYQKHRGHRQNYLAALGRCNL